MMNPEMLDLLATGVSGGLLPSRLVGCLSPARRQMVRQPFIPSGEVRALPHAGSPSLGGGDEDVQRLHRWSYRLPSSRANACAPRAVFGGSWRSQTPGREPDGEKPTRLGR